MKKIFFAAIIIMLLFSVVKAGNINNEENEITLAKSFYFSQPVIKESDSYITLQLQETSHTLQNPGQPELPMFTYSLDLPFGTKIIKIKFLEKSVFELDLTKKIRPTPQPVEMANLNIESSGLIEDSKVYLSKEFYPSSWYDTKITSGLNSNKERVTHVSFYIYPVKYAPSLNKISYITESTIEVTYDLPKQKITFNEEYNLVIIAPKEFSNSLQSLINHKNSINTKTFLKTTEDIYKEYTGFDKPEKIKYFIKDAIETYNITNVLIVGGLKSLLYAKDRDNCNQGSSAWHVPVRYTNIHKTGLKDPGALCDLYYSDIYDGEGNFSSWDSNEDGIYANWGYTSARDTLDLNPDVYVGRLPCRNKNQVKTVVKKIIQYETNTPNANDWYKRMIGISGLSHEPYNDQPDGEYLTDLAMSYVDGIITEEVRCYASNEGTSKPIPEIKDVSKQFTKGARFVYFSGHGNPLVWVTHPADTIDEWMERIYSYDLWRLFNFKKLPIVVVGGCHDAQFNITLWTTYKSSDLGNDHWYWTHGSPGSACFCWKMMLIPWGGAVATIGGTGLTSSLSGQPNSGNGRLATDFFYKIGQDGATTFGEAFAGATQKFIDENTIGLWQAHVLTIWNALGDPSLKI
ncbi:hypothetical protein AYK20_01860 [Thermoplasmatales archaeon SG8-52-1]|nr:MAG: hypothetical protein AYK20_01860 [Thermoplasmatales archaeon SG8-52-1]